MKALETSNYKTDLSTSDSYIYQQTMPKNKEMFPWILHALDTAPTPSRVYKPYYLLTKDPVNIPLDATEKEKLTDPRIEDYPLTSPSSVDPSELSELDQMLWSQLETRTTTTTTTKPMALQKKPQPSNEQL